MELIAYFDAAVRPQPDNRCGIGVIIKTPLNETVKTISKYMGPRTVNEGEYLAAIRATEEVIRLGVTNLLLFGDSQLVVFQVNGRYEVHAENLKALHHHLVGLLAKIPTWRVRYVPRGENKEADRLSRLELDNVRKEVPKFDSSVGDRR